MIKFSALILLLSLLLVNIFGQVSRNNDTLQHKYFYVGGEYINISVANQTGQYMINQIYVEKHNPPQQSQQYPIVFIHGLGQTAANFLNTPDGREGWASYFLSQGYTVYLPDQPSRGRSPWTPNIGTMAVSDTNTIERLFTVTKELGTWPQAKLHTQWPGSGRVGDPIFDALFAAQVQFLSDERISEAQNARAFSALLDKIGPAHIVTHSQAGSFGWRIADLRPRLVKSIVALEPAGPPYTAGFTGSAPIRAFGITHLEIAYEPPAGPNGSFIHTTTIPAKDADHEECIIQAEPAKKLVNLEHIPVLVVTGEASYHAPYDYCTVNYLKQIGVQVEHLELGMEGIHGNGHMMFMEKNNLEIADRIDKWLQQTIS